MKGSNVGGVRSQSGVKVVSKWCQSSVKVVSKLCQSNVKVVSN